MDFAPNGLDQLNIKQEEEEEEKDFPMNAQTDAKPASSINLLTLNKHTLKKNGAYVLTFLKEVTGTQRFLEQDDGTKQCSNKKIESCQQERFLEQMNDECGCLPWFWTPALKISVTKTDIQLNFYLIPQNFTICTLTSTSCYKRVTTEDLGCRASCSGFYADVTWTEGREAMQNPKIIALKEEYLLYKRLFVKNIELDTDQPTGGKIYAYNFS